MVLDWLPPETALAVEKLNLALNVFSVPEIDQLLSKTVLFRGKKFRPTLCFLTGQLIGLDFPSLEPYARAAEFVHAATLAHDDVIDESPVRRNRPTLNARSSNARAVLAGDLLLARVMAELSQLGEIQIIHDLSNTVEELVHGEWLQLEARKIAKVSRTHLETVARKKTASLMIWCCTAPVRLKRMDDSFIPLFQMFGECLGIVFQMIDDIIDYDLKSEKPFGHDLREGLVNFVTLELLEENPKLYEPVQKLLGDKTNFKNWPWSTLELQYACDRVRARACAKLEVATHILDQIQFKSQGALNQTALQAFQSILIYLRKRAK